MPIPSANDLANQYGGERRQQMEQWLETEVFTPEALKVLASGKEIYVSKSEADAKGFTLSEIAQLLIALKSGYHTYFQKTPGRHSETYLTIVIPSINNLQLPRP